MFRCLLVVACALATFGAPVSAEPIFVGGTGTIVYGVAPYGGAPIPGAPTYIGNTFNGLTDILTSPGGGYLTANPVVTNNIYASGINALPLSFSAAGGGNGNGAFGSANTLVTGPTFGGNLTDSIVGDGAVSYMIASWTSTWVESVGFNGLIGASIAAGGTFGSAASSGALSLRVRVQSASVGNLDLGQLVLAPRATGPCFGINGIVSCTGNSFDGAALSASPVNFVAGEVVTVYATLTAIADGMSFETIALTDTPPLLLQDVLTQYGPLPSSNLVSSTAVSSVPEPTSLLLLGTGLLGAGVRRWRQGRA